ncbi:hypothetical protein HMPREF1624_05421 [Sporothrix schenckii ATCC 58251]|uniref:Ribosomal RNA-processing protein 17 n=1 Tax=Sporothrix schenckii (strain ATCC 58251 / de Perez 2211183) TaxID=1391915 RepID=U7PV58_SPOS1|nr:hypothetical protein HMPREF1624_05421 [Sporothrix schenckii ATCC 58251]
MFITRPREKKNPLAAQPRKKRKADYAIEEINFDDSARSDYLTGFHKRKVQRQKQAQEIATEKARQEKIAFRKEASKQSPEQRQKDVENHVRQVNEALRQARLAGGEEVTDEEEEGDDEEWQGFSGDEETPTAPEFVDHEEEYIDEDKYTTVTVEAVDIDREGMHALSGRHTSDSEESEADSDEGSDGDGDGDGATKKKRFKKGDPAAADDKDHKKKKEWPKKKKKQFRYESKAERALSRSKNKKGKRSF